MNGLYLQYEELWMESTIGTKRWEEGECTYTVDRNHQRSEIAVDHSSL